MKVDVKPAEVVTLTPVTSTQGIPMQRLQSLAQREVVHHI